MKNTAKHPLESSLDLSNRISRRIGLLLALAVLLAFWPVTTFDFVNFDDGIYVVSNPRVRAGLTREGVVWAFRTTDNANWHPLTWLSHMLDVELFGASAAGPHAVNVLFHTVNTLLVFGLLRQLTGAMWKSAWVGALFALHPLHVESVAWVAERKDVLSTFFALLTLLAYGQYARTKKAGPVAASELKLAAAHGRAGHSGAWLTLAVGFYALGLMSKAMLVTLPFLMLLLDYWPLYRLTAGSRAELISGLKGLVVEKVPFLLLSGLSCFLTLYAGKQGGVLETLGHLPVAGRVSTALMAYLGYLSKALFPMHLAVLYPHPGHWPATEVVAAGLLLLGLSLVAWALGRRRPYVVTGWFWFAGMLVPVSGLLQAGPQYMADRFMYLPLVGLAILAAWSAEELVHRYVSSRGACLALASVVLLACAWGTRRQLSHWKDGEHLFRHAAAVTRKNTIAYNNLGDCLFRQGRWEEALVNYRLAVAADPTYAIAHNNLAIALAAQGQFSDAVQEYRLAVNLQPNYLNARLNLGDLLAGLGRHPEAVEQYAQALQFAPDHPRIQCKLGKAWAAAGDLDRAKACYEQAIRADPAYAEAYYLSALILMQQKKELEAVACLEKALELNPDYRAAEDQLQSLRSAR